MQLAPAKRSKQRMTRNQRLEIFETLAEFKAATGQESPWHKVDYAYKNLKNLKAKKMYNIYTVLNHADEI